MPVNSKSEWRLERIWSIQKNVAVTYQGRRHYLTPKQVQEYEQLYEKPEKFWVKGGKVTFDEPPEFVHRPEKF